jgi:hypothetical protein
MTRNAELPHPLIIPQERGPDKQDFRIPSVFVDKFKLLDRHLGVQPQFIAGALVNEYPDQTDEEIAERARRLSEADQCIKSNAGSSILHISRGALDAGIAGNDGLVLRYGGSSVDHGSVAMVRTTADVHMGFTGTLNRFNARGSFNERGKLSFFVPRHVITHRTTGEARNLAEDIWKTNGGILAVGSKAVDYLVSVIEYHDLPAVRRDMAKALQIAKPFLHSIT